MLAYTLRRLVIAILILIVVSVGVFFLIVHSGNPLGAQLANPKIPRSTIRAEGNALHLYDPFFRRYWIWVTGVFHGNFGQQVNGLQVSKQMWPKLLITLRMVIPATILSIVIAIGLGVWAALRANRAADAVITSVNYVFISAPVFVLGLVIVNWVAIPLNDAAGKTWLYTVGEQSATLSGSFFGSRLPDYAAHDALPVLTLVLAVYPFWVLYQRSQMLEVLESDYVRLARAKGLSNRRVLIRHTLRNALVPVTTVIALDFAGLLGGALLVEQVFDWDGLGAWGFNAVTNLDFNAELAYVMVTAFFVIAFNFLADLAYGLLDPRIRLA